MRTPCAELYRRCEEGENILLVSACPFESSSHTVGKGSLHVRGHAESGLKALRVDTVIYIHPPTDRVCELCAQAVRLSPSPLIVHDYY